MTHQIIPILCNEKHMANYAYLITADNSPNTIIIDAAEANPILAELEQRHLTPSHILTTHHHFDHVEGNIALKEKYNCEIIAPEKEFNKIPGATPAVKEGDILNINGLEIKVIEAPGHTLGHVLYYLPKELKLFTGDVLFNLCVGGLFEGTPSQMFTSLQKIKSLPDTTEIFPGHEYTRSCLPKDFATTPQAKAYINKMLAREQGLFAPATLQEEKEFNPYLKANTLSEFIEQE